MEPFIIEGKSISELFHAHLPENLYINHYDLARKYRNSFTPEEWRKFLRENERFILNEVASITEASARHALNSLGNGELSSQQVAAIRQLLERSEQINQSNQEQRTFITTHISPDPLPEPKSSGQVLAEHMRIIRTNLENLYGPRWESILNKCEEGEIFRNADGSLHFPPTYMLSELDKAYLRLWNPTNRKSNELPEFDAEMDDVQ